MFSNERSFKSSVVSAGGFVVAVLFLCSAGAFGQTENISQNQTAKTVAVKNTESVPQPILTDYKMVKIGMSADEVRDKIEKKPKVADKDGFYYIFSDEESAQIVLDENKKVRAISITYADKNTAPKYEDVFGSGIAASPGEDGKIYNLVRYPEAGYWIAYDRTGGDSPTITVTIQKI